jgi:hypothetical protein
MQRAAGFLHDDSPQTKLDKLDVLLPQTATAGDYDGGHSCNTVVGCPIVGPWPLLVNARRYAAPWQGCSRQTTTLRCVTLAEDRRLVQERSINGRAAPPTEWPHFQATGRRQAQNYQYKREHHLHNDFTYRRPRSLEPVFAELILNCARGRFSVD